MSKLVGNVGARGDDEMSTLHAYFHSMTDPVSSVIHGLRLYQAHRRLESPTDCIQAMYRIAGCSPSSRTFRGIG